jgi:hypothetical protein
MRNTSRKHNRILLPTYVEKCMVAAALKSKDLLKVVDNLDSDELKSFVEGVLDLRARKINRLLSANERRLVLKLGEHLPAETQKRFDDLDKQRRKGTLTAKELREFIQITEKAERLAARRAAALASLAKLTKIPVDELMAVFGMA